MKKTFFLSVILIINLAYGQTYLKLNGVTSLVAVPQIGIETSIGQKTTFQLDVLASFWESINGSPYKGVMIFPEIRYHFKENFNGFYVGAHVGVAAYKIQKWNYSHLNVYQEGYGLFLGATLGYQRQLNEKWMLDVFIGGGSQSSAYKSYDKDTGERYEDDTAKKFNKSGEWLPYRGGLMISYKL